MWTGGQDAVGAHSLTKLDVETAVVENGSQQLLRRAGVDFLHGLLVFLTRVVKTPETIFVVGCN